MLRGTLYKLFVWLLALAGASAAACWFLLERRFPAAGVLLLLAVVSAIAVIRLYRMHAERVAYMFDSIENDDFTFRFSEQSGARSDRLFNRSLNRIRDLMFGIKLQVAEKERYYELIMSRSGSGVLIIDSQGSVCQHNAAALEMLGMPVLTHIRQLGMVDERLPALLADIRPGGTEVFSFHTEKDVTTLSMNASLFESGGKKLKILSMSNIGNELERAEVESWMRLTRVLTHEIMNSVTPISSLSSTLLELPREQFADIRSGLQAISRTSRSLSAFVESYRRFTRVPAPDPQFFIFRPLLEEVLALDGEGAISDIEPEDLRLFADRGMVRQILLNLIKNGREAGGSVSVRAYTDAAGRKTFVEVHDTGAGIDPAVLEDIFVPFFTTKEGGSGIGLSLSRQMMRRHGGSLFLRDSVPGGTTFVLMFPDPSVSMEYAFPAG